MKGYFLDKMRDAQNVWNKVLMYFWATTRWFSLRLDLTTTLIVLVTGIVSVMLKGDNANLASLALSYSLRLSAYVQWMVRQYIESEANMTSVERVRQYSSDISRERDLPPNEHLDEINWISKGEIEFEHVSAAYGEVKVLKDLNFKVRPGEKIGVVGRTGAGKSSLVNVLFRLLELSSGTIKVSKFGFFIIIIITVIYFFLYQIDGVDIARLNLFQLRTQLSIIPQFPVLFQGTLRDNLDPFSEHLTEELQDVCDRVQISISLDDEIGQGGGNLSLGQRQLVCIARSILKKSRILVVDEATANIDTATDIILQKVLRTEFRDSTVITVAHRINTIVDCSRILVLDQGKVLEFDTPAKLSQREDSRFRKLIGKNSNFVCF